MIRLTVEIMRQYVQGTITGTLSYNLPTTEWSLEWSNGRGAQFCPIWEITIYGIKVISYNKAHLGLQWYCMMSFIS
jgi:hypothetical protein